MTKKRKSALVIVVAVLVIVGVGIFLLTKDDPLIEDFKELFKDAMPYDPESEAQWDELKERLAARGPKVAVELAQLAREVATGDELAHVSSTYFFEAIWLLPKDQLREAGLLLVEMPEDYLPDQYTRLNGLWALALAHDSRDVGIVLNSLKSKHREVRAFATYCLGFWTDELVHDEVAKTMQNKNDSMQFKACVAAFNVGVKAFEEEFKGLATEGNVSAVRCIALEALANLGDEEARQALFEMATKGTWTSRCMAVESLTRLGAYDNWQRLATLPEDGEDLLNIHLLAAVLEYLLECPDAEAKALARDRIGGDEELRVLLDEERNWPYRKVTREDGKGYQLHAPPP